METLQVKNKHIGASPFTKYFKEASQMKICPQGSVSAYYLHFIKEFFDRKLLNWYSAIAGPLI